ncbi:MAG: short-chain dehydrogenase/reductase [Hydrocarboniphaga sp.]|uniref:SDR family NAD(P)-dependent oxidoreductase n=1 Tax=Hydrocarboniphaga sp. TaxID=2033016 RepID=UPI0026241351|nr:SDR family oxidoreductase [Hydrocarboniphaga sp.]MDB5972299.1 short-chain dehydrogenase/reductase [Hydrocarboniphaga sp.]
MGGLFDLSGKVALVTGGNRGIGLGMAKALAEAGAEVAIWGSNPLRNVEAKSKLAALGLDVHAQTVDVTKEDDVVAGIAEVLAVLGRLDCVFACAGISGKVQPFAAATTENLDDVFRVNINGTFWVFREACKAMIERAKAGEPGGSLVAISSLGAIDGMPRAQAYALSKGALPALMRAIAVEYARHGIRANTVMPGWIHTEMTEPLREGSAFRDRVEPRIPMRRWGTAADLAGIAVYLASDASAYHTADSFLIDGGYSVY